MKKIIVLLTAITTLFSCSENETATDISKQEKGGFARFKDTPVTTAGLSTGKFIAELEDANGNIASYKIISVGGKFNGVVTPAVAANITLPFPGKVEISLSTLAGLLGGTLADLNYGDEFSIVAEVTTKDGKKYKGVLPQDGGNTSVDLLNTGLGFKNAMAFKFTIACPSYDASQMYGTYKVDTDPFGFIDPAHTFVCQAGANPNELKFVNWTDEGKDLIVVINPSSQSCTVARQEAWFHPTYGWATVDGSGLAFSCIGKVSLNLTHRVAAGSFGTHPVSLIKQ